MGSVGQPHLPSFDAPHGARCELCGAVLSGYFVRDTRGRLMCGAHEPQLRHCRFCTAAFIPGAYGAGADRCGRCASRAVNDDAEAAGRFARVLGWYERKGLALPGPGLPITLRDRMPVAPDGMPMLGFTEKSARPQIVMQRGLSPEVFLTVAVHEIGHAWLLASKASLPELLEEGVCNWLAWHFAREMTTADALWQATRIEMRDDPLYGAGFRQVQAAGRDLEPRDLPTLITRLKR
jgi:hypothetical protein